MKKIMKEARMTSIGTGDSYDVTTIWYSTKITAKGTSGNNKKEVTLEVRDASNGKVIAKGKVILNGTEKTLESFEERIKAGKYCITVIPLENDIPYKITTIFYK